ETEAPEENARRKLSAKNFDFIVLNSLRDPGAGFGHGTNRITLITEAESVTFATKPKPLVAQDILAKLHTLL
ncbi:MAG: phosphopantothenoylcysteine decarboxylase, partial [Bacteroidota bacterium]